MHASYLEAAIDTVAPLYTVCTKTAIRRLLILETVCSGRALYW